jgi:hypothetical protein
MQRILLAATVVVAGLMSTVRADNPAPPSSSTPTPVASDPSTPSTHTAPRPTLFDPARHMPLSEVKPGMKGYLRTVVSGTEIVQHDVEVITVMHNAMSSTRSVIMIRCKGEFMNHVISVQGMSGSPVYLFDDAGKPRLIGAYAYGWGFLKDPIAGVQPIEYMMQLTPGAKAVAGGGEGNHRLVDSPVVWNMAADGRIPAFEKLDGATKPNTMLAPPSTTDATENATQLRPLSIPLGISGAHPRTLKLARELFEPMGFTPMAAPAGNGAADRDIKLEPGSSMAGVLVSGDMSLAAFGTCTEVIGDRVFGFGHPFLADGDTSVPFTGGSVDLVVPIVTASFKLGSPSKAVGTIDLDTEVGIAGTVGSPVKMFPITVNVTTAQGTKRTFQFQSALHRALTPRLIAMSAMQAMMDAGTPPIDLTSRFKITTEFAGGEKLTSSGVATSMDDGLNGFARELMWPVGVALENPFGKVEPTSVVVDLSISEGFKSSMILGARSPQLEHKPGDEVTLFVDIRQYRGPDETKQVKFKLPADLPPGDYEIMVTDRRGNLQVEAETNPGSFNAKNVKEMFEVMKKVSTYGENYEAIYVRLPYQPDGVAIGRTAMEKLPASKRMIYSGLGRTDVTPTVRSVVNVFPVDSVVMGRASVTIKVKKD